MHFFVAYTRNPTVIWRLFLENPREDPHKPYIARNSLSKTCAANSVSIFINFYAIISESRILGKLEGRQTGAKIEFNAKYPFTVIEGHALWDIWKDDDGLRISLYNNAGLISKISEEIAKMPKIVVLDNSTVVDASSPENPRENPHKPYIARNWK